jgi:alpha-beta hydrolase superfamily lysophospholipase
LAKGFSEAGYDFAGIDQRNFGYSTYPGNKYNGVIESWEATVEDHFNFFDKLDNKIGGRDVPKFLIGYSLGGLMATHFSVIRPTYFKALGLLAPYYTLFDEKLFDKYRGPLG